MIIQLNQTTNEMQLQQEQEKEQHNERLLSQKEHESITKYIADLDILLRRLSEETKLLGLRRKNLLQDVNVLISLYETEGDILYYNDGNCIFLYENDKKEVVHVFNHTERIDNSSSQLSLFN